MSGDSQPETINPPDAGLSTQDQTTTPKRGRGGPRPGSGRPKGAKDKTKRLSQKYKATFAERYREQVEIHADKLIQAAITAGTRGDSRMLLDMVTRFVGPARTAVEVSGPNGAPLQLQAMTAAALVSLTDAQLDALSQLHQDLGLVASVDPGSSLPLSSPLLLGRPSARQPDLHAQADTHTETQTQTETLTLTDTQTDADAEREENGGSSGSASTEPAGAAGFTLRVLDADGGGESDED